MEDKVIERKWEDGALADISDALGRSMDIVRTADELTDENAKLKLLEGVNLILGNCIEQIQKRANNGALTPNDPVIDDYDD